MKFNTNFMGILTDKKEFQYYKAKTSFHIVQELISREMELIILGKEFKRSFNKNSNQRIMCGRYNLEIGVIWDLKEFLIFLMQIS